MAMCGHSRTEIVPAEGLVVALGLLLPAILSGCEWHCAVTRAGCGLRPGGAAPSGLQTLPAAGFLWRGHSCCCPGCSGQAETGSHRPGCAGGSCRVRACSQIPIQSQSQIPAERESLTPWVFAFKGSILYFTKILCVCFVCVCLWGTEFIPEALWDSSGSLGGQSLSRGAAE